MNIAFNDAGVPLLAIGQSTKVTTKGAPKGVGKTEIIKPVPIVEKNDNGVTIGNYKIWPWGSNNDYPKIADEILGKTGVLRSALRYRQNLTLGSGIYPVQVTGYTENGSETVTIINDPEIKKLIKSRMIRKYLQEALRDMLRLGMGFPEFIMNEAGDKIAAIHEVNAKFVRLVEKNKNGIIEKAIVSGRFPDSPGDEFEVVDVLDPFDPLADLERRKIANKTAKKKFIYLIQDPMSSNEYYTTPDWDTARLAGWLDIANKVPTMLANMYDNQMSLKYHVRIPYAYWDRKFPRNEYKSIAERNTAITKFMDKIEETLCGATNARKALFSMYEINPQGKAEEKWEIDVLDDKFKNDQQLVTSAAANSEILFSVLVNPAVVGAMPSGGGPYQTQSGGSNIREAFLVNIALAWLDRQNLLDPIECMIAFNYGEDKDVELRFKNVFLTTLDTGGGTSTNVG